MLHWETNFEGTLLKAGPASKLDELLASIPAAAEGTPAISVTVVELRKVSEFAGQAELAAQLKEKSINYVPIPVTAETFSEQDMDAFRRECLRKRNQVWTICSDGQRSVFLGVASLARMKQLSYEAALEQAPGLEAVWKTELKSYLERHQRALALTVRYVPE